MARNSFYTGSVTNAIAIDTSAEEAAASATAAAASASTAATQASNAASSATSSAASFDSFDDRYLGAKSSAPSTDNDGNSLIAGALYWNTSSDQIFVREGSAWVAIKPTTAEQADIAAVENIKANVTTVAGIASNVTSVAGNATNINAVAADASDIGTVAGKATEIGRLGTSDAVADMAILGTSDVVTDLNTLGTADVVSDMNTLGTSGNVTNMNTLAGISGNVTTVAGISSNVTTVAGIASNVTSVADNASNINAVAGNATNINAASSSAAAALVSKNAAAASAATATTKANTATAQAAIATTKAQGTAADRVATAADVVSSASNAAAAAATYDNFDDRYLGAKGSEPSVDNDGNSLVVGALYFDSNGGTMKVYTASGWLATSSASLATMNRFVFTATNNQTVFQGNDAGGDTLAIVVGAEIVTLNGVVLEVAADYSVTTSKITLASGAAANDELNVYAFGNFTIASHYSKTAADARFEPLDSAYTKAEANTLLNAKAPLASPTFTGNISMPNGSIDTAHIGDDQVTADKLANSINSAITANTNKVTNATHSGEVTGSGALTIANDAVTTAKLNLISTSSVPSLEARSDGTTDGYIQLNCTANSHGIKLKSPPHSAGASYTLTFPNDDGSSGQALTTNGSGVMTWETPPSTNATHSGEVTGATALTIADNVVDEANLKVSNTPTNGYFLSAQSGNTGGMTWAEASGVTTLGGLTDVTMDIANFTDSLLIQPNSDGSAPTTGTLSNALYNIGIGKSTFSALTSGDFNVGLGYNSLAADTTGSQNTSLGANSMLVNTTGSNNVSVGYDSLKANTTGANNTASGYQALKANTTASDNTAIGYRSLATNTTGAGATAVGRDSLYSNTTGTFNTAVGKYALWSNTTAGYNTAIGYDSLQGTTTGASNTGLGVNALRVNTTGAENVAVGKDSLLANTTGGFNVAVGERALAYNTTANYNIAMGKKALWKNTTGATNIGIGYEALKTNTTGNSNNALGSQALHANTTGVRNIAIGTTSLFTNTTGLENTGVGYNALYYNTTGAYNTAIGRSAMSANTTADNNTAVGGESLRSNTTGTPNTAVGRKALYTATTAANNTAIGYQAMYSITDGSHNVAVGHNALSSLTSHGYNTAVGVAALESTVNAHANTAVGYKAMNVNSSGSNNTAVGFEARKANTTAANGTSLGYKAGEAVTTGNDNICVGVESGAYSVDITDGTRNVCIGNYSHTSSPGAYDQIVLGYNVQGSTHTTLTFGNGGSDTTCSFGSTSWSAPSDQRLKEEITTATAGLSFVNDLRPVTFKWKKEKDIPTDLAGYKEGSETRFKTDTTEHGFIAQEVKTVIDAHSEIKDGFDMWSEDDNGRQRLADSSLVPMLVKAIQELSTKNDALVARITALEA